MTNANTAETTHLDALELRLSNERIRLANARTEAERIARAVTVAACEKEIASERAFMSRENPVAMTDDEILAELNS